MLVVGELLVPVAELEPGVPEGPVGPPLGLLIQVAEGVAHEGLVGLPAPLCEELGPLEALGLGEKFGPGADEEDVGGDLQDPAGYGDGVGEALDGGDGPGPHRRAVHDGGVHLGHAEEVGDPSQADACVVRVSLHRPYRGLDGVHGGASVPESVHAALEHVLRVPGPYDEGSDHGYQGRFAEVP